jgi:propanol-preferring alcohol dehydrogenase
MTTTVARVRATAVAESATRMLARIHGAVVFVQSAGCCDGSAPMCFSSGDYLIGDNEVLVGSVAGSPFYVDRRQLDAWSHDEIVVDVEAGYADGFSLPAWQRAALRQPHLHRRGSNNTKGTIMKAAVVTSFSSPLEIQEREVPEPGPGQVLVRMEACGLCHTDIHAAHGDWPVKPTPPFVPGHEGVGIVERVGPGVTERAVGDRVAIAWLGSACGHCSYCVKGWETLCESQQNSGYSVDGAFAEYAVADAAYVVPVPDGVSAFDAAPLTCAGVTTYKAIKVADVRPTERVAVFGIGGLGHLAVQYACIFGGEVIAVDVEQAKLDLALELGASHVVNAREVDPVAAIQEFGGADVAVALAVSPHSFEQAFASLRRGGRLVCVALPPETDGPMRLPIFDTVLKGVSVIGSIVGTREDLAEVFTLHAQGRTRVIADGRKLGDVNASIDEVLSGRVPARLVFEF